MSVLASLLLFALAILREDGASLFAITCATIKVYSADLLEILMNPDGSALPRKRRITSIEIDSLFGQYSYALKSVDDLESPVNDLLIIYGDNGSGKTSILQLLYHLLSKGENEGHRGYLARMPFRSLSVSLGPEITVTADRPLGNRVGDYRIRLLRYSSEYAEAFAFASPEGRIQSGSWPLEHRARWDDFIRELQALDIELFYLAENRQGQPALYDMGEDELSYAQSDYSLSQRLLARGSTVVRRDPVAAAISSLEEWVRSEALKGSTLGEANINSIYLDVARRIAHTGTRVSSDFTGIQRLLAEMARIESESQPFADLGLFSRPRLDELRHLLQAATPSTQGIIASVVQPYIESVNARLEALRPLQGVLRTFLLHASDFLSNKVVTFDLKSGVQIATRSGEKLEPQMLSSGERQLILLFCSTLTARARGTIALIDEPEISLNVKWQRMLIDALLALVQGASVQFILATHSVELLAQHRDRVWRLHPSSFH